jgi:hypothetical protein
VTVLAKASSNLTYQPTAQFYVGKDVLVQSHNPEIILLVGAVQQHTATAASVALSCTRLPHTSGRNEANPTTNTTSVSPGS